MSKTLYLLRHAQAMPAVQGDDKARTLTPKGKEDCEALGARLKRKDIQIDHVLCSAATRTQDTWAHILKRYEGEAELEINERLYNAPHDRLMDNIFALPDDAENALLIAHNPGIHQLAFALAHDAGESILGRLSRKFSPGTLVSVECNIQSWADFDAANAQVTELVDPLDYNAPATPARWT